MLLAITVPLLIWAPLPVWLRLAGAIVVLVVLWAAPKSTWFDAELSLPEGLAIPLLLAAPAPWLGIHWAIAGGAFLLIYGVGKIAKGQQRLSLIGLAVGCVMPIPFAMSLLIGGLIAKGVKWKAGEEWFGRNRNIIVGGLAVGEGVVIGLLAAVAALRSSLIALPY